MARAELPAGSAGRALPTTPAPAKAGHDARGWRASLARHPWRWVAAAALVSALLWFSHLPSLLLNAQLYADDSGWYETAYRFGPILSLYHPDNGYLVLLQRVVAAISLALPLIVVPTFFNAAALLVLLGGIAYLLSPRMAEAIRSPVARAAIALLVLCLPNAYDTMGNLTNSQWHLALIAFLVVFAATPRGPWGWIADGAVLLLSGLTGPYCILLLPIAAWSLLLHRRSRRQWLVLSAVAACSALQAAVILFANGARISGTLAAGVAPLVTMVGRQLSLGLTAGAHGLTALLGTPLAGNLVILGFLTALPLAVCVGAAWRGPEILRALCVFALLELILALAAPSIDSPFWPNLGEPASIVNFHPHGIRYFLFPLLAFAISLGWLAWTGVVGPWLGAVRRGLRSDLAARLAGAGAGVVLLVAAVQGVPRDWVYPPYIDQHWAAEVQRFESSAPGTTVVMPINPAGWNLTLVSR